MYTSVTADRNNIGDHSNNIHRSEHYYSAKFVAKSECIAISNSDSEDIFNDSRREIFRLNDDINSSDDGSTHSWISCSDNGNNDISCSYDMRSTRETLTREWLEKISLEETDGELNFTLDSNSGNADNSSETEIVNSKREKLMFKDDSGGILFEKESPTSSRSNINVCNDTDICRGLVFLDVSNEEKESFDSNFSFAEALTEENCDSGFSFSTKGSLTHLEDDEFSEECELDLMFYTSPLTSTNLPGWYDMADEGSGLSQSSISEGFIDLFQPKKISTALQNINESWNKNMIDVENSPREPVKVSFSSNLVTVHCFEKIKVESKISEMHVADQLRFKRRVNELSSLLSPFLSLEHRANIYLRNSYLFDQL